MTGEAQTDTSVERRKRILRYALIAWGTVVAIWFGWQALTYTGLVERAAGWQFGRLAQYFPFATVTILIFLFGLPLLHLLRPKAHVIHDAGTQGARHLAGRFMRSLAVASVTVGVVALIVLLFGLMSWRDTDTPNKLVVGSTAIGDPSTGATAFEGMVAYDRIASAQTRIGLTSSTTQFAPVLTRPGTALQLFVETAEQPGPPRKTVLRGMLVRNGLRGDIAQLYQDSGYTLASPYYVLFTTKDATRRPYFLLSGQLAVVAVLLALMALLQRYRVRRMSPGRRRGTAHAVG